MLNVLVPIFTLLLGFFLNELKEYFYSNKKIKKEIYFKLYAPFLSLYVEYNKIGCPLNYDNKEFQNKLKNLILKNIAYVDFTTLTFWQILYSSLDFKNINSTEKYIELIKIMLLNASIMEEKIELPSKAKFLYENLQNNHFHKE